MKVENKINQLGILPIYIYIYINIVNFLLATLNYLGHK